MRRFSLYIDVLTFVAASISMLAILLHATSQATGGSEKAWLTLSVGTLIGFWIGFGVSWWMRREARESQEAARALLDTCETMLGMRCAECDCNNPPDGCNWIAPGPLHTADEEFK